MADLPDRRRRVSGACSLFAALAVGGSMFLQLYHGSFGYAAEPLWVVEFFAWSTEADNGGWAPISPRMGYPLAFAVVLLLGAAVLARPVRTARVAGVAAAAGLAFLVGVGWSIVMQLAAFAEGQRMAESFDEGAAAEWAVGPGLGLLLVAGAFAGAATVAAFLPVRREEEPADPYQADVATPRYGFPKPVP